MCVLYSARTFTVVHAIVLDIIIHIVYWSVEYTSNWYMSTTNAHSAQNVLGSSYGQLRSTLGIRQLRSTCAHMFTVRRLYTWFTLSAQHLLH
jgi:hypothetical protein